MDTKLSLQMAQKLDREISNTVKKEERKLLSFIRKRVNTNEDAQDILQDVFYQFAKVSNNLGNIEKATSWLYKVARNRVIDWYRKKKDFSYEDQFKFTDKDLFVEELLPIFNSVTPEDEYTNDVFWDMLEEALAELPENQKTVFIEHEINGKSFKELSEETGLTVNTLISRKRYAVMHLRTVFKEMFNEL